MALNKSILTLPPEQLGEIAAGLEIFSDGLTNCIEFAYNLETGEDSENSFYDEVSVYLDPVYDEAFSVMEEALPEGLDLYDVSTEISNGERSILDREYETADEVDDEYSKLIDIIDKTIDDLRSLAKQNQKNKEQQNKDIMLLVKDVPDGYELVEEGKPEMLPGMSEPMVFGIKVRRLSDGKVVNVVISGDKVKNKSDYLEELEFLFKYAKSYRSYRY